MTVIRPRGVPLDGKPANPTSSRRLNALRSWLPVGADGDTLYHHLAGPCPPWTGDTSTSTPAPYPVAGVGAGDTRRLLDARYADILAAIDRRLDATKS